MMKPKTLMIFVVAVFVTGFVTVLEAEENLAPSKIGPHGSAPGIRSRLLSENNGVKEYILIFEKGDEVLSGLTTFAADHKIQSAHFHGIGALKKSAFGSFDSNGNIYHIRRMNEQAEVLSLLGDVAVFGNKPVVHAHVTLADREGKALGGHLVEGIVFPTLEVFLTAYPKPLIKKADPETDLRIIHPEVVGD
jgi:predicted DNA-binding protein with PD1-like motif